MKRQRSAKFTKAAGRIAARNDTKSDCYGEVSMSNSSDPRVVVLTMLSQKSSSILHSLGRVSKSLEDQREAQLAQLEKRMPQILDEVKHNGDRGSRCDHGELVAKALERISQQASTISVCQRIQSSLAFEEIHRREEGIAEPHANTFEWIFN